MTEALDQAAQAAARLPEEEQDRLAAKIMEKLHAVQIERAQNLRAFQEEAFVFRHEQVKSRAFDSAVEAAARLPGEEQDKLAAEIMEKVREMRRQRLLAWLDKIEREGGPFDGKSEQILAHVREFREGFVFKHDRDDQE